jgi:CO/xanthine dehydrogenase Mo-binding subunit
LAPSCHLKVYRVSKVSGPVRRTNVCGTITLTLCDSASQSTAAHAHAGAWAAHFVEVHVDPDPGTIRVARVVTAVDGGRILNPKTARSQIIEGIVGGIGMALLEDTVSDRTGRVVTTSLADYVLAANADVRDVDVLFVGQPDPMTPLGTKGVGELAIVGMAAAIANAVYHATGAGPLVADLDREGARTRGLHARQFFPCGDRRKSPERESRGRLRTEP